MNGVSLLRNLVQEQHRGNPAGIYSVCSSHPSVVQAALSQAQRDDGVVLIEATSNQVNQFGGYTGMTPEKFHDFVLSQAEVMGFDAGRVMLGGDHLGPIPFRHEDAPYAMEKACGMVRSFVEAGFVKIHLDTSMPLGGASSIDPQEVAERCVQLCLVCEETHRALAGSAGKRSSPAPVYIIGTEVPVPGGSDEVEEGVRVTSTGDFEETVAITRHAFIQAGLDEAWERVIAVVVQPGVEFGDHRILEYRREDAAALSRKLRAYPHLVFEAHSTDYQTAQKMREMVEDGFAILKVGPGLTFAFREAVFMLCAIEDELVMHKGHMRSSELVATLDRVMVKNPLHWAGYYEGDEEEKAFKRRYSLFDRVRYYWNDQRVQASLQRLLHNLKEVKIPLTLISQFFPTQYRKVRDGELESDPEVLIRDRVMEVLADYSFAAGMVRTF